jgi:hypothetical protein
MPCRRRSRPAAGAFQEQFADCGLHGQSISCSSLGACVCLFRNVKADKHVESLLTKHRSSVYIQYCVP